MTTQALNALEQANAIRLTAAAERRRIAALPRTEGVLAVAEVLADPDEATGSLRLMTLLRTPPRIHRRIIGRVLDAAEVNPYRAERRLRELSDRERRGLIMALHRYLERGPEGL